MIPQTYFVDFFRVTLYFSELKILNEIILKSILFVFASYKIIKIKVVFHFENMIYLKRFCLLYKYFLDLFI